jgi:putative addiction module killer protein
MIETLIVKTLPEFDTWLDGLKDRVTVMRLKTRLRKVMLGNLGDIKPVGDGVFEMREFSAPAGGCTTSNEGMSLS